MWRRRKMWLKKQASLLTIHESSSICTTWADSSSCSQTLKRSVSSSHSSRWRYQGVPHSRHQGSFSPDARSHNLDNALFHAPCSSQTYFRNKRNQLTLFRTRLYQYLVTRTWGHYSKRWVWIRAVQQAFQEQRMSGDATAWSWSKLKRALQASWWEL